MQILVFQLSIVRYLSYYNDKSKIKVVNYLFKLDIIINFKIVRFFLREMNLQEIWDL